MFLLDVVCTMTADLLSAAFLAHAQVHQHPEYGASTREATKEILSLSVALLAEKAHPTPEGEFPSAPSAGGGCGEPEPEPDLVSSRVRGRKPSVPDHNRGNASKAEAAADASLDLASIARILALMATVNMRAVLIRVIETKSFTGVQHIVSGHVDEGGTVDSDLIENKIVIPHGAPHRTLKYSTTQALGPVAIGWLAYWRWKRATLCSPLRWSSAAKQLYNDFEYHCLEDESHTGGDLDTWLACVVGAGAITAFEATQLRDQVRRGTMCRETDEVFLRAECLTDWREFRAAAVNVLNAFFAAGLPPGQLQLPALWNQAAAAAAAAGAPNGGANYANHAFQAYGFAIPIGHGGLAAGIAGGGPGAPGGAGVGAGAAGPGGGAPAPVPAPGGGAPPGDGSGGEDSSEGEEVD